MNILLENGNVNPPFLEGTANILLTHAKELSNRGHNVVILTRRKSIITGKKYPAYQEIGKIKVYRWSNYANLFFLYQKLVKREKIDVIHIFSKGLRPITYIRFLTNFIKKPVIFSSIGFPNTEEETQEKFESDEKTKNKLIAFVKNVEMIVVTSKFIFDKTPEFRKKNCTYLPYGIDILRFSKKNKSRSNKIKIIYLRSPSKELLAAFQKTLNTFEKTAFIFNKHYIEKNEALKKFVSKNNKRVELIPELKDISLIFNKASIVIDTHNPKKYLECASPPLLLLEAMACELKVISTRMGEIEEFIQNEKNGFLIEENTSEQIYLALKKAIRAGKAINENARRTISRDYDIRKVIKNYEEIYSFLKK